MIAILGVLLVSAVPASAAGGVGTLSQHPGAEGCVTSDGTDGTPAATGIECRVGHGFNEINTTVVSPDGRFLYATSSDPASAVLVFAIDQTNGSLTQLPGLDGCVSNTGGDGTVAGAGLCTAGRGLLEARHLTLSPDGKQLYVAGAGGAVAVFARDATTGVLTQLAGTDGCVRQGAAGPDGCAVGRGIGEPTSVTVSHDGKNVYVTGSGGPDGIGVFARDASTGALTQLAGLDGCVTNDGTDGSGGFCVGGRALLEPTSLVVSGDGKNVYASISEATAAAPGAVAAFSRNPTTGALTQLAGTLGCNGPVGPPEACAPAKALYDAITIAITPDDKHVYVAGQGQTTSAMGVGAVAAFARDATTGGLTQLAGTAGCVSANGGDGTDAGVPGQCTMARALIEPNGITFGPGADQVYVAAGDDSAVGVFGRNLATGELTQLDGEDGCMRAPGGQGCKAGRALGSGVNQGPRNLVIGPNCNFVYVAATDTPGIAVLRRGCTPPTSAATVAACSTSGAVPLAVTDAAGAVRAKRMHLRVDGGTEQVVATTAGATGIATVDLPEGRHSLEYWGEDETGVLEAVHHTVQVVVDRTPPVVVISGRRSLTVGEKASAKVTATDSISGLAEDPTAAAVPLDTASAGQRTLTRVAVDRCGNRGTSTFTYQVTAPLLLSCQRTTIALIDLVRTGRRVRITGQASPADAGKSVQLLLSDRGRTKAKLVLVGTARIGPTGLFAATVPPGKSVGTPEYLARAPDGSLSGRLKLKRRMLTDSATVAAGKITIKGHVTAPLPRKAGQVVTVKVRTSCGAATSAGRAKLDRRGRFTVTFAAPVNVSEVLVRTETKVPKRKGRPARFRTFSLPRPVPLGYGLPGGSR